jgi:hypothetical protein
LVAPVCAADRVARNTGLAFDRGDSRAGDDAAAAIGDDAVNLTLLSECRTGEETDEGRRREDSESHLEPPFSEANRQREYVKRRRM